MKLTSPCTGRSRWSIVVISIALAIAATGPTDADRGIAGQRGQAPDGLRQASTPAPARAADESTERAAEQYGKLPMSFEENRGQADGRARFLARGKGYNI